MKNFPYHVFLSHNRAQKGWTRNLARELDEKAIKPWFDEWCLEGGTVASIGMERGIQESRHVLLVLSPEFLLSEWTDYETQIAIVMSPANRDRKLVPILYSPCEVPARISRLTWIDFRDTHGDPDRYAYKLAQLLADLRPDLYKRPKDFERFLQQRPQPNGNPDQIPPVSPLPKGSRMPRAPIGNFVGREKELRDMARGLTPGSMVGVHAAVTGMGGVGKTQLAIEYAHRYGNRYPGGVFWLNMEKAEDAVTEVASCGGPGGMNLEGFSDQTAPEQAALVHQCWEDGDLPCLLIFDNAEEPEVVEKWRPKHGKCSVLITCRRDYWPMEMNVQPMPIERLPRAKSMELLEKVRPALRNDKADFSAADDLCDHLGDLPLALHVAASYLDRYRNELVQDYLRDLQQASSNDPALENVWSCFAVSYHKLKPENETDLLAIRVFQLAGYFAPASIARELLTETAGLNYGDNKQRKQFNHAVIRLQELGLIAEEPDKRLILHRLLREFARQQQSPLNQSGTVQRVAEVLTSFARKENATRLPQKMSRERVHLRQAATEVEQLDLDLAASLYNDLGYHAASLALLKEAKSDYEKALKLWQGTLGPDHPTVASVLTNIGATLKNQGDLAGALEYTRRALQIDERISGSDHPKVAIRANNIGQILKAQGDLAGALEYTRRALQIDEKVYGPDHPHVAICANNIGGILKGQGDLAGALEYTRRALQVDEKVYGPNHPSVAIRANNIGQILQDQGDLAGALEYTRRALHIDEKVYGSEHPTVATLVNNIGGILQDQGDLAGAMEYTRRALQIDEKVYGPDHPDVAIDVGNIGRILQDQGDLVGAMEYTRRALAIFEKVYGPEHPDTKDCANNLRGVQELIDQNKSK